MRASFAPAQPVVQVDDVAEPRCSPRYRRTSAADADVGAPRSSDQITVSVPRIAAWRSVARPP